MSERAAPSIQPLDPGRINLLDPEEVRYWCDELCCSEAQLAEAVDRVGSHTAAVRQLLLPPQE